jgi:hypothetical protein
MFMVTSDPTYPGHVDYKVKDISKIPRSEPHVTTILDELVIINVRITSSLSNAEKGAVI